MKSVKIGQLTPISNRLLPIDRSAPHKAPSHPPSVAVRRAWQCRDDQTLGDDVAECHCVHRGRNSSISGGQINTCCERRHDTDVSRDGDRKTEELFITRRTENVRDLVKEVKTETTLIDRLVDSIFTDDAKSEEAVDTPNTQLTTDLKTELVQCTTKTVSDSGTEVFKVLNKGAAYDIKTEVGKDLNKGADSNIKTEDFRDVNNDCDSVSNIQPVKDNIPDFTTPIDIDFLKSRNIDPSVSTRQDPSVSTRLDPSVSTELTTFRSLFYRPSIVHINRKPRLQQQPLMTRAGCIQTPLSTAVTTQVCTQFNQPRLKRSATDGPENYRQHRLGANRRPWSYSASVGDHVTSSDAVNVINSCGEETPLTALQSRFLLDRRDDLESRHLDPMEASMLERVYMNNLNNAQSSSSSDVSLTCSCRDKQILSVCHQGFHVKRLSHQYLNSSVTGHAYPFFFSDTGELDSPQFQSEMIFNAARNNFPGPEDLKSPSLHQYYNKSQIFQNVNSEDNHKSSMEEKKKNKEFDLSLFIPLSQMRCPFGRFSHSPQYQHHLQHSTKYQQFNGQENWQDQKFSREPEASGYLLAQQFGNPAAATSFSSCSQSSLLQHFTCRHREYSISPVSLLWSFLSILVAATCLLSFLTPFWAVHPDHVHSFGLLNLCVRDQRFSHPRSVCVNFGYQQMYTFRQVNNETEIFPHIVDTPRLDLARIPSGAWQAACLLFGAGVSVQILGALVSLVVLTLSEPWHRRVALSNGYVQTVGAPAIAPVTPPFHSSSYSSSHSTISQLQIWLQSHHHATVPAIAPVTPPCHSSSYSSSHSTISQLQL
ncbi:hypothetical protein Btru_019363 [Bulinus truncatus]|nr:hypothetical protein Btru_019363 [Bulinus truncatus]